MFERRIWWAFLLVLAVGIAVSARIVTLGDSVQAVNHLFISEKLPLSQKLGELRGVIADEERILYEYYSYTLTRSAFHEQRQLNRRHWETILSGLGGNVPQQQLLHTQLMDLEQLSDNLSEILGNENVNWDQARVFLALAKPKVRQIEATLASMTQANQLTVDKLGAESQTSVATMVGWVLGFSVLIFSVSFFVGYYVVAIIREGIERRRLAMFPERDPNPVFRLGISGEVLFANPATDSLRTHLQLADYRQLLPSDLAQRLAVTSASPSANTQFDYACGNYTLECTLAYLSDFSEFHAYVKDVTARKQAEEKLAYQAFYDPVSGLPNQFQLRTDLQQAISEHRCCTLMMVVADREQEIFENFGAAVTELWLVQIAQRLSNQSLTPQQQTYRFGSNAFIIVIWSGDLADARILAEQLALAARQPVQVEGYKLFSSLSIGASLMAGNADNVAEVQVQQAASACNRVRRAGGSDFALYDDAMGRAAAKTLSLSTDLQHAVDNGELRLHYQPKVDAASGRLLGMEALVRWIHPKLGMISPVDFIPIAEDTGLIVGIGRWVLFEACRQNAQWQQTGLRPLRVAINLSARQFRSGHLLEEIDAALRDSALPVSSLELEITESMVMDDPEGVIELLESLHQRGIHLALDDFGTGHSSLAYLKRFPIDCVKIDRAFIKDTPANADDVAIARTIVAMAQALNLSTVAEGVETAEQLELLNSMGCEQIQGYFFSRPLPPEDFLAYYQSHQ